MKECEDRYRDFQGKMKQEIEKLQSQVAAVVSEREGALEQATQLSASLRELEQKVQGLEAQKDQLEEDKFTTQTVLQELQSQHEQVIECMKVIHTYIDSSVAIIMHAVCARYSV